MHLIALVYTQNVYWMQKCTQLHFVSCSGESRLNQCLNLLRRVTLPIYWKSGTIKLSFFDLCFIWVYSARTWTLRCSCRLNYRIFFYQILVCFVYEKNHNKGVNLTPQCNCRLPVWLSATAKKHQCLLLSDSYLIRNNESSYPSMRFKPLQYQYSSGASTDLFSIQTGIEIHATYNSWNNGNLWKCRSFRFPEHRKGDPWLTAQCYRCR